MRGRWAKGPGGDSDRESVAQTPAVLGGRSQASCRGRHLPFQRVNNGDDVGALQWQIWWLMQTEDISVQATLISGSLTSE